MKTANLTVRIDPKLKRQVQDAAAFLDVSLSQVFTAAAKGLVRQAASLESWRGDFKATPVHQGVERDGEDFALTVHQQKIGARIAQLVELERRSGLDAKERAELTALSLRQVMF